MKKIANAYFSLFLLLGLLLSACGDDSNPAPTVGTVAGTFAPANSLTAVTFTNAQGTATAGVLNQSGTFTVSLPPGSYTLSFTAAVGYATPAPQVVVVTAGQTTTLATITVVQASRSSLLMGKNWRLTDLKASGFSIYSSVINVCNQDDIVQFNADKSLTYIANTKCDPTEPATATGSWDLLANDTKLRITDPNGQVIEGTITSLTATSLVLSGSQDLLGNGTLIPVELTFTAQ